MWYDINEYLVLEYKMEKSMRSSIFIGKDKYIYDAMEISYEYLSLAIADEKAGKLLADKKLYNQACYHYIQALEKYIKAAICSRVNVTNAYYADKLRDIGHSVDKAVIFLLDIVTAGKDELMSTMIRDQLMNKVLQGIKFSRYHNAVRYPDYYRLKKNYRVAYMDQKDCLKLENIVQVLKKYLEEINYI